MVIRTAMANTQIASGAQLYDRGLRFEFVMPLV